jgi:hypothetical protein
LSNEELAASAELHARVLRFGRAGLAAESPPESFEQLALAIAAHQRRHNPVLGRLWTQPGAASALAHIPAVPADAFRLGRVASFDAAQDSARFQTSGTTGGAGVHAFRTLETYRELSVAWGARELFGETVTERRGARRWTVLALAPVFEPERRSSLGYMMQEFMRELDGRALSGAGFVAREPGRWLVTQGRLDREGLERGVARARERGERVALLATSFALSWLLDALGGEHLPLPPGSVVMQTGGFKGHVRTLDDAELAAATCAALAIRPRQLIGEYGMTELSSQLYDTGFGCGPDGQSCYREPPWLRVTPVDPITLLPVAEGQVGLARFTDLANVDSSLAILTQDQVRRVPGGVLLLGRRRGASLRGCSLAVEALMPPRPEPLRTESSEPRP